MHRLETDQSGASQWKNKIKMTIIIYVQEEGCHDENK